MRRILSRSLGRKLTVTCIAVVAFVLLYEVTMFDSREVAPSGPVNPTLPAAGARLLFTATAYCKGTTTASGVGVRTGIAASDPGILPVGSVVNVSTDDAKYNGVYTIMDTGPKVQGRVLDLYMWSCREALAFGRRPVEITVLRLGWNPGASTPSLIERLFRRREAARNVRPAPPSVAPDAGANSVDAADNANRASDSANGAGSGGSSPAPSDLVPPAPSDVGIVPVAPIAPVAPASKAP